MIHQANQMEIDNYLSEMNLFLLENQFTDKYDEAYFYSVKEDLEWMKEKDKEIFATGGTELYLKEFASHIFLTRLLQINEEFLIDYIELDEDRIILESQGVQLGYEHIVIWEEVTLVLEEATSEERIIFEYVIDNLAYEYGVMKKQQINDAPNKERKFVEAKKLLLLSYI